MRLSFVKAVIIFSLCALLANVSSGQVATSILQVAPTEPRASTGTAGGSTWTPDAFNFSLLSIGFGTVSWTATVDVNWITLSAASGTIPPKQAVNVTATIDGDASALAIGAHTATITFTNTTHGNTYERQIVLTATEAYLVPGTEWGGATAEPGQIGTGTAKCIARWDVVPHQVITEATTPTFTVGVVAFHIAGIDKVSFNIENGDWLDVQEMTLNPFTNVWEYCATFDLSDFAADEEVEIRAIAYPNAAAPQAEGTGAYPGGGYPRLLEGLKLWVDVDTARTPNIVYASVDTGSDSTGDGTINNPVKTVWKAAQIADTNGGADDANGAFIYLTGGSYTWDQPGGGAEGVTTNRWLTIQPKPGFMRWEVVFETAGWAPGIGVDLIHLKDVTVNTFLRANESASHKLWIDGVDWIGNGRGTEVDNNVGITYGFEGGTWCTDSIVRENRSSVPRNLKMLRNHVGQFNSYGFNGAPLVLNSVWSDMAPYNSGAHPGFINFNHYEGSSNHIVYGVRCERVDGEPIFWKDITGSGLNDVAIVNCALGSVGGWSSAIAAGTSVGGNHFLLWNTTHVAGGYLSFCGDPSTIQNFSVRGSALGKVDLKEDASSVPDGWFDQNHYGLGFNAITPGTNITTGDPLIDTATFAPSIGSPLLNRMGTLVVPVDVYGTPRTVPGCVGAVERD